MSNGELNSNTGNLADRLPKYVVGYVVLVFLLVGLNDAVGLIKPRLSVFADSVTYYYAFLLLLPGIGLLVIGMGSELSDMSLFADEPTRPRLIRVRLVVRQFASLCVLIALAFFLLHLANRDWRATELELWRSSALTALQDSGERLCAEKLAEDFRRSDDLYFESLDAEPPY